MSALVRIEEDRVVADSRDVASEFGKRHHHVLRTIDRLVRVDGDLATNFGCKVYPILTGDGATRHGRRFDMDRKGFMLLVMGFTGEKALALKVRWIDAFDAMERRLLEREQADRALEDSAANDVMDAIPHLDFREKLLFVREARVLGGRAAGRKAWQVVDLPDVFDDVRGMPQVSLIELPDSMTDWMEARTDAQPGHRVAARRLYSDYVIWARAQRISEGLIVSETKFGRTLQSIGIHRFRGQNENYRVALRLRPD